MLRKGACACIDNRFLMSFEIWISIFKVTASEANLDWACDGSEASSAALLVLCPGAGFAQYDGNTIGFKLCVSNSTLRRYASNNSKSMLQ